MGLKVAMITPWMTRCGIFTYSRDLIDGLVENGVETYVIRFPRFGHKTPELMENMVKKIPLDEIDIIHCQHEYGLYTLLESSLFPMLKTLGKPIVTTMHSVGNDRSDGIISQNSDSVIVHNEFCKKYYRFPSTIIPHGCKSIKKDITAESAKTNIGIDPKIPVVGYLGFISEVKGLDILIEAMKSIKTAALLIGGGWHLEGDTIYISRLREDSYKTLTGRCQWLGFVEDEALASVYAAMDLVVYPSRHATESGALLMALSHGKAVIANNIAPFKEKEDMKALVTFQDQEDLMNKIRYILKDRDARSMLEAGARSYAEANSWEKVAEKHLELYNNISTI